MDKKNCKRQNSIYRDPSGDCQDISYLSGSFFTSLAVSFGTMRKKLAPPQTNHLGSEDLLSDKMAEIGRVGGKATLRKKGKKFFSRIAQKSWVKRPKDKVGGRPKGSTKK